MQDLTPSLSDGELGIVLGAGTAPELPDPAAILTGTAPANYLAAASGGQRVEGLAGADMILGSGFSGADHLLGGDGNDLITAALAAGVRLLNIGSTTIPGLTADIIWADAQSGFGRSTGLVYDGAGNDAPAGWARHDTEWRLAA